MTTLVVPLDGSEFAERALRPACALAAQLPRGRVALVTVNPQSAEDTERYLRDRAGLFANVIDVELEVIEHGDPGDGILEAAAARPHSIVCMATHGHGGLRALLGSVAERVICRSADPMVLVGPQCRVSLLPGEAGRMVVCSDGSQFSEEIMPIASAWAGYLRLEPWVVEVVAPDEAVVPADQPVRDREVEAASERLTRLTSPLDARGEPAHWKVLHGADLGETIAGFASRLPAVLIAMATHGRSGLARAALGSVATDVVRSSPCPVLIVRPAGAEQSC
jgi:nucleotide-binding universal stress UspA family protein